MSDNRTLTDHIDTLSIDASEVRRLPDGSIDLTHYCRHGRALHGNALRWAFGRAFSLPLRIGCRVLRRKRNGAAGSTVTGIVAPAE